MIGNIVVYIIYKLLNIHFSNSDRVKTNWEQYLCLVPQNSPNNPTTCLGDGGGPMVCNNKQYGINSFMYSVIPENNVSCGALYQQVVYVFVDAHRKWLNNIIEPKKKKKKSSGNFLKARHYTLYIILTLFLCNMLTFI